MKWVRFYVGLCPFEPQVWGNMKRAIIDEIAIAIYIVLEPLDICGDTTALRRRYTHVHLNWVCDHQYPMCLQVSKDTGTWFWDIVMYNSRIHKSYRLQWQAIVLFLISLHYAWNHCSSSNLLHCWMGNFTYWVTVSLLVLLCGNRILWQWIHKCQKHRSMWHNIVNGSTELSEYRQEFGEWFIVDCLCGLSRSKFSRINLTAWTIYQFI